LIRRYRTEGRRQQGNAGGGVGGVGPGSGGLQGLIGSNMMGSAPPAFCGRRSGARDPITESPQPRTGGWDSAASGGAGEGTASTSPETAASGPTASRPSHVPEPHPHPATLGYRDQGGDGDSWRADLEGQLGSTGPDHCAGAPQRVRHGHGALSADPGGGAPHRHLVGYPPPRLCQRDRLANAPARYESQGTLRFREAQARECSNTPGFGPSLYRSDGSSCSGPQS
jgi:hypothetical protein